MPSAPSTANQTTMTGPKKSPTTPVPRRWIANSTVRMSTVTGTTQASSPGADADSTADSTEVAGVIMLSPEELGGCEMPYRHHPGQACGAAACVTTSDSRAGEPPAAVVRAHQDEHVPERDQHHDRPQHESDRMPRMFPGVTGIGMVAVEDLPQGVQGWCR